VGRKYGNGNLEEKNLEVEVFVAKNTEEKFLAQKIGSAQ